MQEGSILGSKGLVGGMEAATQTEPVADIEGILSRFLEHTLSTLRSPLIYGECLLDMLAVLPQGWVTTKVKL